MLICITAQFCGHKNLRTNIEINYRNEVNRGALKRMIISKFPNSNFLFARCAKWDEYGTSILTLHFGQWSSWN